MMIWMLVAGALAVWYFVLRPKWSPSLPPGTMGWPLLGEFLSFYFQPDGFIAKRREKHGNLFKTCLLGDPVIISTDPDVNNFILESDGRLFAPKYWISVEMLVGKRALMAFTKDGPDHRKMRGAATRVAGIPVLKRRLVSEIQNTIASTLSRWRGKNVNVRHEAEEMMFSLIANILLGLKPGTKLEKMTHDYYIMNKGVLSLPLNVPGTTFYKSLQKRQEISDQIKSIVKERKEILSSYDSSDDLLSSLLKEAEGKEDVDFEDRIVDIIMCIMFAAFETTPKTTALTVKLLSENPHIIQELREEHEAIRCTNGNKDSLSWDDYKSMSFTRNVIKEVQRLGIGSINAMLLRKTLQKVEMQGYTIPKGWTCILLHQVSHFDRNYYEDPLTFNPRRWQDPATNRVPSFNFGGGPRKCPGYDLAMFLISIFLHHLATNFRWDYIPSDTKLRWFDSPFKSNLDCIVRLEDWGN